MCAYCARVLCVRLLHVRLLCLCLLCVHAVFALAVCACIRACMHPCVHASVRACVRACMRPCVACVRARAYLDLLADVCLLVDLHERVIDGILHL